MKIKTLIKSWTDHNALNKNPPLPIKRLILISSVIILLIICTFFGSLVYRNTRPFQIGFYSVPDQTRTVLISIAQRQITETKRKIVPVILDETQSVLSQKKRISRLDLVFLLDGKASANLASLARPPDSALISLMPSAISMAGSDGASRYGTPLLLDHFEVAYLKSFNNEKNASTLKPLDTLLATAASMKKTSFWPIVCAGANDRNLLLLTGALAELNSGYEGWLNIVEGISAGKSFVELLGSTSLKKTLDTLVQWRNDGVLHPEWFRMTDTDIVSFMENGYAGIAFIGLSTHRTIPLRVIEKFDSVFFSSQEKARNLSRALTAPVLLGIEINKKRPDRLASEILAYLVGPKGQKELSGATGLAPVNSTAETSDVQASDVRLWVAASSRPLPNIANAALDDPAAQKELARKIREYLEAGGEGY